MLVHSGWALVEFEPDRRMGETVGVSPKLTIAGAGGPRRAGGQDPSPRAAGSNPVLELLAAGHADCTAAPNRPSTNHTIGTHRCPGAGVKG